MLFVYCCEEKEAHFAIENCVTALQGTRYELHVNARIGVDEMDEIGIIGKMIRLTNLHVVSVVDR